MNQDLIKYFENVLGVKAFLRPEQNPISVSKTVIYIENFKTYSAQEIELTGKILAAIGLNLEAVQIVESSQVPSSIAFVDDPKTTAEIHSPRILMQKPELKKTAWENLKSIKSRTSV